MRNAGERDSSITKKFSSGSPCRPQQMIVEVVPEFVERNGNDKQFSLHASNRVQVIVLSHQQPGVVIVGTADKTRVATKRD